MLLRFRVANHRSIRDEATLSMVGSSLRGATPPGGAWGTATLRVAGIYGANTSGKSTVLDALSFLVSVVRHSATAWADRDTLPYEPFALDAVSQEQPSLYEIDFVVDGIRYTFGFRSQTSGIVDEWLYTYPTGRRRLLYARDGQEFEFGRTLPGENVRIGRTTRPTALFLSTAANNGHRFLGTVHHAIARQIRYARFTESDRAARLQWIIHLVEDEAVLRAAVALLRFADFGISTIEVQDEPMPDDLRAMLRAMLEAMPRSSRGQIGDQPDDVLLRAQKQFRFVHTGSRGNDGDPGEPARFTLAQESSGTVAWLSLAVPALDALRHGHVFVVDEIDSSLHPTLTAELVSVFKDPDVNTQAAQMIFTSHDTSLLGSLHGKLLEADEVWLTERSPDGATELYSAAEFAVRPRDNIERRYLQGRYGAMPALARAEIRQTLGGERRRVAS